MIYLKTLSIINLKVSDPQWGYELTDIEHIQYTKYKINGHYDWHSDYMWSEETRECESCQ